MAFDIEAAMVAWLNANFGCEAATEVPNPRPKRFVSVERTGGPSDRFTDSPTVALQCWAPTRAEAADMACRLRDMLPSFVYEANIREVGVNSLANFPAADSPRYQLVVNIRTR